MMEDNVHARMTERHKARLRELAENDRLTPEAVLADAKNPKSPLHDLYDWDVDKAAHAAWIARTRQIIKSYIVTERIVKETITYSYFTRDPAKAPSEQGYVAVEALRENPALARAALIDECNRIAGAVTRARGIAAKLDMAAEFEDLLRRVVKLRTRLEQEREEIERDVEEARVQ